MRKFVLLVISAIFFSLSLMAQEKTITGKVTEATGTPVSGASVMIKGTNTGTSTDAAGNFTLKLTASAKTLVISAIGFEKQEIAISGRSSITVSLSPQGSQEIGEVVVTGSGSGTSKKKLAIAVESITSDKLPAAPTSDIGSALVGKIPGALISTVNGNPGQPVNILLRGINSIQAGTRPMILLDGLEVRATDLNSLDLTSIERVEVVQGPAAAAIYGAQGANGVIQLFSKKGKSGSVRIDFSSGVSRNSLINHKGNLSKAKFHSLNTDASGNVVGGSGNPLVFNEDLSTYEENVVWNSLLPTNNNNKPYDKNLKWYDHNAMFYQTATTFNNSLAISGGKDKFDFSLSGSDSRQ
jgi:TonB-dependent SusC/RagA subfamily outer membrane receptor